MKISDLVKFGEYEILTNPDYEDKEITVCYIRDLLSWVMGRANSGDMWITVMSNINIVAVATLSDASCIVLAEDVDVESGIIDKANSQNVVILKTAKTSYEAAVDYYKLSSKNV